MATGGLMPLHVLTSKSASARLEAVGDFLRSQPPAAEVLIVGASRGAADDVARQYARQTGGTFGLIRLGFTDLAARLATERLADARSVPSSLFGAEALATRATFDAVADNDLQYFEPVARLPGFPKALARTLHELRLAGVTPEQLASGSSAAADLARLLARVESELATASIADRAALFGLATAACGRAGKDSRWTGRPMVLVDVALGSTAEAVFARTLAAHASAAFATVPDGDIATLEALRSDDQSVEAVDDPAPIESDLWHLRRFVFSASRPAPRTRAGDVRLFSAPGEGREAVEIVRRVLDEAAAGVPFDQMAVFLRAPQHYVGLLEHACARGDVPVYFDRGTRRPDPAGRAFLALLSCAAEGLSAKRFDEYLSLGQVPRLGEAARNEAKLADPVPPRDDLFAFIDSPVASLDDDASEADDLPPLVDTEDEAIVSGTLRAPWKWEELIVESSVVAGRTRADGRARWRRRLDGLAADYRYRLKELKTEEPDSALIRRLERDLKNLAHLRAFALPIVDLLADWPDQASWGEWLDRFNALAAHALRRPTRVQALLAELRPMSAVTGVALDEVRRVLHDQLATLDWEPPSRRYGRLFVGTPHQARGRMFRVVFIPGLAERVVPQRPREDPLLLDARRAQLHSGLVDQEQRASAERLLLKIAVGAATDRVYLSYPRLDGAAEGRARVPSFYALDVMRAVTGRVPDHRLLAIEAAEEAGASLAWPAPRHPDRAIDALEHDLSVLRPLLDSRDEASARGRAHYMLGLNSALRRSITSRWLRDKSAWSASDGLAGSNATLAPYLARHRLGARPYSLSALQRFSVCPYQFLLATIHRLEPWIEPEPLVRLDPLTRGSLYHRVQADFQRELKARGGLPPSPATVGEAVRLLDSIVDRVAAEYEERLAPAIERIWNDEIADLRRDLSIWVRRMADGAEWIPEYFEFSFGLNDEGRDPRSLADAVTIDGRFILRGSVDLIERHETLDVLRVTDHKTGKNRSNPDLIVGGGGTLQPVLYSMAVEQGLGKRVIQGRLYYSTTVGGFADKPIEINDYARAQALQVLTIIDRAVEQGFLVAAPGERACTWCDFRPVCGPREEERVQRKAKDRLADLGVLRSMR
jgi:ATP-dependent helicase/nuclease subunit B